ncbi:ribokinase [Isoptericola jiangsuensis]|uniref:Ribokinase n=1 Tax=Isoptericola jiangsuensis TaxID=548579 RepID=A0A2A9ESY2_9MICO|nr:ribokinase [Isoptericola jiangsuensis]PFG41641.1 ribokinase [Isoptericola jiangsuensis]
MPSIVVVGSVNADIVTRVAAQPVPGETVLAESMAVLPGGKGANQAVAAARLGADVWLVGAVGTGPFADTALAGLRTSGVHLDAVAEVDGHSGVALVTVSADGENSIVVVPGANSTVDADVVARHADLLARADVVVLQAEIPVPGIEAAARAAGGRVLLNLAPVVDLDPSVLALADPLVVNAGEARRLLDDAARPVPDAPFAVVDALLELGPRSVVLTMGGAGAVVAEASTDDGAPVVVPAPHVEPLDTTGAGDAFVGALAWRLLGGDTLADAARTAVRAGAYSVTTHGAQRSFPAADDVLPG